MTKDEARQLCKTDRMYLGKVLGYDFQDDVHPDMFAALDESLGKLWRLILWPRGHFKTSCVVVDIVASILNDPDIRILVMQATLKLTKGWIREISSHFNGKNPKSRLLELFPEFAVIEGDAEGFTIGARQRMHLKERTVTAASPKAAGTGQHYTKGYFDDLVNQNNYKNVEAQDQLEKDFDLYQPLIDPGGLVCVTGTRYSFADLYQRIIKRNVSDNSWEISIRECYKSDGTLLFPARDLKDGRVIGFTAALLAQLQKNDPETFSAQYLNKILVGKSQKFPESLILSCVRSTTDPNFPHHTPSYFFIDLAEGKKRDSDHSVLTIGKLDHKNALWIVDVLGDTWSVSQLTGIVLQQTLVYRPRFIYVEKQPGAEFAAEFMRTMAAQRGIALPLELVPGSRQKDAKILRIESTEVPFRTGKLLLSAGIHDFDRLQEEYTQFPRGRHDDRPDCIAHLFNKLNSQITTQAPIIPRQSPWFVQSVLASENSSPDNNGYRNMCGDGFV